MTPAVQYLVDKITALEAEEIDELLVEIDIILDSKLNNVPKEPSHEHD